MASAVITGEPQALARRPCARLPGKRTTWRCWISMGRPAVLRRRTGRVVFFETDVSKRASIVQSVQAAVAQLGAPDVLFANAGIQKLSSLFDLKDEDVDAIIDINLMSALYGGRRGGAHA